MKYIVYWILSWTAYVECPPQVDEFGRTPYSHPNYSLSLGTQPCTEEKTKLMNKEFDDFESASRFLKRALDVKQKENSMDSWNSFSHQRIDTAWMVTKKAEFQTTGDILWIDDNGLLLIGNHEHNDLCPIINCKEK